METKAQPETRKSALGDAIVLTTVNPKEREAGQGEIVGQAKSGRRCILKKKERRKNLGRKVIK